MAKHSIYIEHEEAVGESRIENKYLPVFHLYGKRRSSAISYPPYSSRWHDCWEKQGRAISIPISFCCCAFGCISSLYTKPKKDAAMHTGRSAFCSIFLYLLCIYSFLILRYTIHISFSAKEFCYGTLHSLSAKLRRSAPASLRRRFAGILPKSAASGHRQSGAACLGRAVHQRQPRFGYRIFQRLQHALRVLSKQHDQPESIRSGSIRFPAAGNL